MWWNTPPDEEKISLKVYVLIIALILVAVIVLITWSIVIDITRKMQTAYSSGSRIQNQCGFSYLEKETGRWRIYNTYNDMKTKGYSVNAALAGIMVSFFILFILMFIIVLGATAPMVKSLALYQGSWQIKDNPLLPGTAATGAVAALANVAGQLAGLSGPTKTQFIFLLFCVFLWLGSIGVMCYLLAVASRTSIDPLSNPNTKLSKYGLDILSTDGASTSKLYVFTALIILGAFGYVFLTRAGLEGLSSLLLLVIFIILMAIISIVYSYLTALEGTLNGKYADKRATLLAKLQTNIPNNPDLWAYLKQNIKRSDNPPEDPEYDDYKDSLGDYVMHANGKEDPVLNIGQCTSTGCQTPNTADQDIAAGHAHIETVTDIMRDLREIGSQMDSTVGNYTRSVYSMTLFLAVVVGYIIMHYLYVSIPAFTIVTLLTLIILIFATVMYIWMSGAIYQ